MKRAFTLFLCLLCVAVILFAPALIQSGLHKNIYSIRADKRAESYTGTLALWHIVSFKTGGQSGVSYLNDRIRKFEKNNPYVYIEITGLTVAEAQDRLAAGEQPDIVSYPLGFFDDASFLAPLEVQDRLAEAFTEVGLIGNTPYAYPYMADFYVLSCNQDSLFSVDAVIPSDAELQAKDIEILLSAFADTPDAIAVTDMVGLSPSESFSHLRPNGALTTTISSTVGLDPFLNAESPLLLSTAAEAAKMSFDKRAVGINMRTYAFSNYTDAVQLVSIAATEDESKQNMCAKFAVSLLANSAQGSLEDVLLLPTTAQEELFQDNPLYGAEYMHLLQYGLIPNSFDYQPNI